MQTNGDDAHLAVARAKFKPVARALEDVSKNLQQEHGRSAVLQQKSPMQPISQNACMVQYSLQHPNEARLSLTFIVVGDEADCVLLQGQERSGPWTPEPTRVKLISTFTGWTSSRTSKRQFGRRSALICRHAHCTRLPEPC
jgi:hypothetical protein